MSDIDLSQIDFYEPDPMGEQIVQFFVNQIRRGRPLTMPCLMKMKNNRYVVVDGLKRLEAAKRCGAVAISAYVVEELKNRPGDTPGLQIEIAVRSFGGAMLMGPLKTKRPADWPGMADQRVEKEAQSGAR